MKIAICSDLHLEFGTISLENTENAEVLILSGDICVAKRLYERDPYNAVGEHDESNKVHKFFQECCARFPRVIYVVGNHEHYNGDYASTITTLRDRLRYLDNLHILEKQCVEFDGINFVGGTLWTDMNGEDEFTLNRIRHYMNDYRIIDNSNEMVSYKVPVYKENENGTYVVEDRGYGMTSTEIERYEFKTRPAKFTPEDSVKDHKAMLECIHQSIELNPSATWVVVGHHAPSKLSTKPQYENDVIVNGAYSSSLDEFIEKHPQIKLWTHGHTHHDFDYTVHNTRVVANPRGYIGYEYQADQFELKFVEV